MGFGVIWGYSGSFGVKTLIFSNTEKLYTKLKLSVSWWRKNSYWGHIGSPWGYLRSFGVKIETFSDMDKLYTKLKVSISWSQKNTYWGHLGSPLGYLRSFGVKIEIWSYWSRYNEKVILEVTRPQIWGHFWIKIQICSNIDNNELK